MLRFCKTLKSKSKAKEELTSLELANAEILLFRLAQAELYGEEINILKANERFVNLAHFIKYLQNWMKISSFAWKDVLI